MSGKVRGKQYNRYIDGGWKAKKGCKFTGIPKEKIESFVRENVIKVVENGLNGGKLMEWVAALLDSEQITVTADKERAASEYRKVDQRIQNLLKLVEDGEAYGASLRARLADLEQQRCELEEKIQRASTQTDALSNETTQERIRQFSENFRERLEKAPVEMQKLIFQKCVARISVDPDESVAHVYIRRIPTISPGIERAFSQFDEKALVVGAECARNPSTHSPPSADCSLRAGRTRQKDGGFRASAGADGLNLKLKSVVGILGTKMPPKEQVAFSFPVPGTGPATKTAGFVRLPPNKRRTGRRTQLELNPSVGVRNQKAPSNNKGAFRFRARNRVHT